MLSTMPDDLTMAIADWAPTAALAMALTSRRLYALLWCRHVRLTLSTDDQPIVRWPLASWLAPPWDQHVTNIQVRKPDPRTVCRRSVQMFADDVRATGGRMRHVTALSLHLPRTLLGDDIAQSLGRALGALPSLVVLRLQLPDNFLGDTGFCDLAAAIGSVPRLQDLHLHLRGNRLGTGAAAGRWPPQLRRVSVDVWDNRLEDATNAALAKAMPRATVSYHWAAGPRAGDCTAQALSQQAGLVTGDVNLRLGMHVGDTGALALAQVVSGPATVLLDLSGNLVGTVGAAALRARPSILTVDLTDNPNVSFV